MPRSPSASSRRTRNALTVSVRVLAEVLSLGGLLVATACNGVPDPCAGDAPDAALHIKVSPRLQPGRATTVGACTSPFCAAPVDGGCAEWQATMTGGTYTTCEVTLTQPPPLTKVDNQTAHGEEFCSKPISRTVEF